MALGAAAGGRIASDVEGAPVGELQRALDSSVDRSNLAGRAKTGQDSSVQHCSLRESGLTKFFIRIQ